jgi:hypothetical protein
VRQREVQTESIQDHANAIREMVEISMRDPETQKLAISLASGNLDWVDDPRTGRPAPVIMYYGRAYRVAIDGSRPPAICQPRDALCEITQIWNFLGLNVRYVGDADGYDDYKDLKTTLESGGADCDDYCIAFAALLRSIGYRCYARIISLDGRSWAHVYPMVEDPKGRVIPLDLTEPSKPLGWQFGQSKAVVDFHLGDA